MKTNFWNEQELITKFLNELLNVINQLPYPGSIRTSLKYNVIVDFFNTWQFDDETNNISYRAVIEDRNKKPLEKLKFTEGIVNFKQANRYVYEFIKLLNHVRVEALEDIFFPVEMFLIDKKKPKKSPTIHDVDKYTLLRGSGIDIYTTDDFTGYLIKMVGDGFEEIMRQNIMADVYQTPPSNDINKIILEHASSKIYMAEELEYMFCIEAVNYYHYLLRHSLRTDYHIDYLKKILEGPLKLKFIERLEEKLAPLPDQMKLFYLDCSFNQFATYSPDVRQHELYDKFWKMFIFPKQNNSTVMDPFIKFMDEILLTYGFQYYSYAQIVEDYFYKYSLEFPEFAQHYISLYEAQKKYYKSAGEAETESNPEPQAGLAYPPLKSNAKNTSIVNSYTYINNQKNYDAIADLWDFLRNKDFIAEDTDKKDFRKIFENKKPNRPITWTGKISYLFLFVKLLHSKYKLIDKLGKKVWVVTDQIFVDENGEAFGSQRLKGQKTPNDTTLLENAMVHLK